MLTWRTGVDAVRASLSQVPTTDEKFLRDLETGKIPRVDGTMIFLTRSTHKVSRLTMDHVHFMGALPRHVISLSVVFADTPRVAAPNCTVVSKVAEGWWQVVAQFGFVEIPDLTHALREVQGMDAAIDLDHAVFIASRDLIVHKPGSKALRGRRLALFAFLYRNAVKAVDRFHLPPQNVVEIARQLEI